MSSGNEWEMHSCIAPHEVSVTCSRYDLSYELLWCGYADGRVSSFMVDQESVMSVYTSFKLNSPVVDVIPTASGIVVVCRDCVSMYVIGGLQQCSYKVNQLYDSTQLVGSLAASVPEAPVTFRCACGLDQALVGNVYTSNSAHRSRVLIGCSTSCVLMVEADADRMTIRSIAQYDVVGLPPLSPKGISPPGGAAVAGATVTGSQGNTPVTSSTAVSITFVLNNFSTLLVAASNGKLYVLDGKILVKVAANTNHHVRAGAREIPHAPVISGQGVTTSSLQCYDKGGYITHLSLDRADNKTLFYCGLVSTGSNVGWKGVNEGFKYTADPLVHILDIRSNLRQLLPMAMPLASPTLIATGLVGADRGDGVVEYRSTMLLSAAATGAMQVAPVYSSVPDQMAASSLYVPLSMRVTNSYTEPKGVHVTSLAVSGSGQYFVIGCNNGSIFQYCHPPAEYQTTAMQVVRYEEGVEPVRCEHPTARIAMHHNAAGLSGWPQDNIVYDCADAEMKRHYNSALLGSVATFTLPYVSSPADFARALASRSYSQGESVMRREQLEEDCVMTGQELHPTATDLLEYPLSSFLSTPHVAQLPVGVSHLARKDIRSEIMRATQQRDFIGYGTNPGYRVRNSLVQMQLLASSRGLKKARAPNRAVTTAGADGLIGPFLPYETPDPRLTPLEKHCINAELSQAPGVGAGGPGIKSSTGTASPSLRPTNTPPYPGQAASALSAVKGNTDAFINPLSVVPPKHLAKNCNSVNNIQLAQAKKGFDKHVYDDLVGLGIGDEDAHRLSASAQAVSSALLTTAGLDNAYHYADCAYLNSLLQVLFNHNDIRALCLRAQKGSYHHRSVEYNAKGAPVLISTPSFLCEIGFIFNMMGQVIEFKHRAMAVGADADADSDADADADAVEWNKRESAAAAGHDNASHAELNSDFDQLVVVPTRFQQIYAHCDQVATLGLLPSVNKRKEETAAAGSGAIGVSTGAGGSTDSSTSAGQLAQSAFRFLLLQLNKEVAAESRYYESLIPPVVVPVLPIPIIGAPKPPPPPPSKPAPRPHLKVNVIDAIFGLDVTCENHFIKSAHTELAPTTHAMCLEMVDPQTILTPPVSALGVRHAPVSTGSHISIAQVLYKSLRKVQFLKGYCTSTQTYDAFQQTRTVKCSSLAAASGAGAADTREISHSLLTILCGQNMLCPQATNPATGAVSIRGSPTLSYIDADGVLHLPRAIEMVSSVSTVSGASIEKLEYVSCLLMVAMPAPVSLPSGATGAMPKDSKEPAKQCWFIFDGKKEEVSNVPASERYHLRSGDHDNNSRTIVQTLDVCSVVSEVRSVTPDRSTGTATTQTHTILHQYVGGEWLLFNDYQIGRAAEESRSALEEVLSCNTAYRRPAILLYAIRPELDLQPASAELEHPLKTIPFKGTSLRNYTVPPAVLSAETLAQNTVRAQYKGQPISYKIALECYKGAGPNASVMYTDDDEGCPVPVIRDGDTHAAVATGALPGSLTETETLFEPFSLHPTSVPYTENKAQSGLYYHLAGARDLIAVDAEFVAIGSEKYEISSAGKRIVSEDSRQVLARVSLLYGGPYDESGVASFDASTSVKRSSSSIRTYVALLSGEPHRHSGVDAATGVATSSSLFFQVLQDDYIIPSHTVTDYLTRFSGIIPEDLYPQTSAHSLTCSRIAYCKLRYYLDRGCIFIGHGLCKDFEIANIHVPSNQVIDTVNIFRLRHQRKISLKFLSFVLLQADIQDEVHDSIEDARTALLLYRLYTFIMSNYGPSYFTSLIHNIYQFGSESGWRINNNVDSETLFNKIYPIID